MMPMAMTRKGSVEASWLAPGPPPVEALSIQRPHPIIDRSHSRLIQNGLSSNRRMLSAPLLFNNLK